MDVLFLTQPCREVQSRRAAPFSLSRQVDHLRQSRVAGQGGSKQHDAEVDDTHNTHNNVEYPNASCGSDFGEHERVHRCARPILVALVLDHSIGDSGQPEPQTDAGDR